MLNVAVIGAGGIGGLHIEEWKATDVNLCALCDTNKERADELAEKYNCKAYYDIDELLKNERLDIADVCTPTFLHKEHALKVMNSGINLLLEKPISLKSENVDILFDTAERKNLKFMVAHVVRFWNEYVKLKEIIDKQTYGKILNAGFNRLSGTPKWSNNNWMVDCSLSGMVPFDLHIHDLDFIVHTFGKPKKMISFRGAKKEQDYYSATYDYGDFFINCEASWFDNHFPFTSGFRAHFEEAVVEFSGGKMRAYQNNGEIKEFCFDNAETESINLPSTDAYLNEIKYFINCVENNKSVDMVPKEDIKIALKLIETGVNNCNEYVVVE